MNKLVDIFCDVDDFCRVFIPEWEKHQLADDSRKRQRDSRMTTSEIVAAQLTTGNVHDTKPVAELAAGLNGKLYADKGYISKKLKAELQDSGVDLVTNVRKNMKAKALSL